MNDMYTHTHRYSNGSAQYIKQPWDEVVLRSVICLLSGNSIVSVFESKHQPARASSRFRIKII